MTPRGGWRRFWTWGTKTALAATSAMVAWASQVLLGAELDTWLYWSLFAGGTSTTAIAFLLPAQHAREQERLAVAAGETAKDRISRNQIQIHGVLAQIVRNVCEIANLSDAPRKEVPRARLQQAVMGAIATLVAKDSRIGYFQLHPGTPRTLRFSGAHAGRENGQRRHFVEGTDRGDAGLQVVFDNKTKWVKNVAVEPVPGYNPHSDDYKCFIAVPVRAESKVFGLITVDCPEVDQQTDIDVRNTELLAALLAAGLSA
jgi:hypothetical protein